MRDHASDGPPQDLAGGSEMERSTAWVTVHPLPQEGEVLQLVSVKRSRNVQQLASDKKNFG